MSTRSMIAIQRDKDTYESIYCHNDGYLTYNGAMLLDHYSDRQKLERLMKLGNLSCLNIKIDPEPNKPHSFDFWERQDDVCVAYGRDRKESDTESKITNLEELLNCNDIDYFYIYDLEGNWKYYYYKNLDKIKDVKEDLDKEYEKMRIKRPEGFYGFWPDSALAEERKRQAKADQGAEM